MVDDVGMTRVYGEELAAEVCRLIQIARITQ